MMCINYTTPRTAARLDYHGQECKRDKLEITLSITLKNL